MARKKKEQPKPKGVTVTTSRGVELVCLPIAYAIVAQEETIHKSIEWPEGPMRIGEGVGGSEMVFPITEEYIKNDERATEEQKEAWEKYQVAQGAAEAEFEDRLTNAKVKLLATKGVCLVDESLWGTWTEDHEWMGVEIPDAPREKAIYFFQTEILGDLEKDILAIMLGIFKASGWDEEVMAEAEATFRVSVGRARGDSADSGAGDTNAPQPESEAGLVEQQDLGGDGSTNQVRGEPGSVGDVEP